MYNEMSFDIEQLEEIDRALISLKDKYPLLGEEIDKVIINTIGLEESELTDEKRKNLRDCLNAVAWGVHQ